MILLCNVIYKLDSLEMLVAIFACFIHYGCFQRTGYAGCAGTEGFG